MNIIVVGGSGFIGTRLVGALLAGGHAVRIFDKAVSAAYPERVTLGDVRDAKALRLALQGIDCAINLAAEHRDDVRPTHLYFDVNVGGAKHLVAAAEAERVQRLLFVSSVSVYGLEQPMADESARLAPCNDYGRSKVQAEAVYAAWAAHEPAVRALTVLRPCVVFGEGNRGNVHTLIDHIRRHRFIMVGRGDNRKSIAYVGNLVDFIFAQIDNAPGRHLYNYADKPDLSTDELVQNIRSLLPGSRRNRLHLPYPPALAVGYLFDALAALRGRPLSISSARIRKFCADTRIAADAAAHSGFRARISLLDGLARTIASEQTSAQHHTR